MAWQRHTRKTTKEVFYGGTTIDGSRLEKALGEVEDAVNAVPKGSLKQRFVATQYHSGFNPQDSTNGANLHHKSPWLRVLNDDSDTQLALAENAPFNRGRFKGTAVPGIEQFDLSNLGGVQYAWTRTFHFSKPAVLHAVSVMMQVDGDTGVNRPYTGTIRAGILPYTYDDQVGGEVPAGFSNGDSTIDVPIVLDVMNPGSPEDAEMTDVEFTRNRYVINNQRTSLIEAHALGVGWVDFTPPYDSGDISNVRPINGRLMEHRDLNIPIHENARVRLAVLIPHYDGVVYSQGSWGDVPWFLQAWSATLTVLEELEAL